MPELPSVVIPNEERGLAALTHLSGLSGYIIPFGGTLVPFIIWMVKKDVPAIAAIAKQAIFLNLAVFVLFVVGIVLLLTVLLIPFAFLLWAVIGLGAIVLPIIGAVKANGGIFYKYPVIGSQP